MIPTPLIIRADATTQIGTGHVMRCIALAQVWQNRGGRITFLSNCESDALRRRIIDEGFDFIPIKKSHPDPLDLTITLENLSTMSNQALPNKWLIIDGYHFTPAYQKAVKDSGYYILVVDDYNHLPYYHADILLNQNIHAKKNKYSCDTDTVQLLGCKYALLRREFLKYKDWQRVPPEKANKILVTLGGADPDNITLKVVRSLLRMELEELKVNIVLGPSNPNTEVLEREIEKARKSGLASMEAMLLLRQGNMPELMATADLAISAGGSTCWELCFLGKPFLVIIAAENQRDISLGLDQAGVAICLGWHHEVTERQIHDHLKSLINDISLRREMSKNGQELVDGKGPLRVLQALADNFR